MEKGVKGMAVQSMKKMKNIIIRILILLSPFFYFNNLQSQSDWNLTFEDWNQADTTPALWHDTLVVQNRVGLFPPKWHFDPDHIPEGIGLAQTTDATEGNYAVALSGYYAYLKMRIISGTDASKPGWPIDFKPTKLTGDYKSILLGDCDSLRAHVKIKLTAFDLLTQQSTTVAESAITLFETSDYTAFNLNLNYLNDLTPDTVIIELSKTRYGFDSPPSCLECSHVFFDNLKLHEMTSATSEPEDQLNYTIAPNPTNDYIYLFIEDHKANLNYSVASIAGKVLMKGSIEKNETKIDINHLPDGIYIISLLDEKQGLLVTRKISKL